jgi:chemotaxis response regulator CheB
VQHLGSDVPARDLIEFVEETLPDLVVLSVTLATPDTGEFCAAVSTSTSVPVMTGGAGRSLGDLLAGIDQDGGRRTRRDAASRGLRSDARVMAGRAPEAPR